MKKKKTQAKKSKPKVKAKKIKFKKKKVSKKTAPIKHAPGAMAVIPYVEIGTVETYKGKFSMVASRFNTRQIENIISATPQQYIITRPGKGKGSPMWDFIPGWWFKKRLNFIFGFDGWDTIIEGERIDGKFITVKGALVIKDTKTGKEIVRKSDYGGKEIMFLKGTDDFLNIANDFKAAQTDLIKRCCVQLGFAMDVYGKNEAKNEGFVVQEEAPKITEVSHAPTPAKKGNSDPVIEAECHGCAGPISKVEADYSLKTFRKQLCRSCQNERRK